MSAREILSGVKDLLAAFHGPGEVTSDVMFKLVDAIMVPVNRRVVSNVDTSVTRALDAHIDER